MSLSIYRLTLIVIPHPLQRSRHLVRHHSLIDPWLVFKLAGEEGHSDGSKNVSAHALPVQ